MKSEPIIIVAGEPNSVFLETFFKCIKKIQKTYYFNLLFKKY